MAKSVSSEFVERAVRQHLRLRGYTLDEERRNGENGADIVAYNGDSTWYIEIIGFQERPPDRSREFYEAFFRVISRDRNLNADTLVIALPERFKRGMPQRKQHYSVAWEKLGRAFPNLRIWYVGVDGAEVEEFTWLEPW